jgi:hypothetical protein
VLVEGGLGVFPGKETRTGEGAARVVEPRDSDGVRSLVGYGVLLCFFTSLFFFCNFLSFFYFPFFLHREGNRSLHRVSQPTRRGGRFGRIHVVVPFLSFFTCQPIGREEQSQARGREGGSRGRQREGMGKFHEGRKKMERTSPGKKETTEGVVRGFALRVGTGVFVCFFLCREGVWRGRECARGEFSWRRRQGAG